MISPDVAQIPFEIRSVADGKWYSVVITKDGDIHIGGDPVDSPDWALSRARRRVETMAKGAVTMLMALQADSVESVARSVAADADRKDRPLYWWTYRLTPRRSAVRLRLDEAGGPHGQS